MIQVLNEHNTESERDIQILAKAGLICFCHTANKGPKHKSVLQFRQLLVMSLKSLKIST